MHKPSSPTGRGAGRWRSLPALLLFSTIIGLGFLGARTPGQTRPATAPVDVVPTTLPAIRYVACYQQPLEYLAQWKARGCNAAVGPELGNPPRTTGAKWCAEAGRLGMGVIGNSSLLKDKFVPPNLVAWICDDEPNETNHAATQPPAYIAAQATAFRLLNPNVPVIVNLAGDRLTSAGAKDAAVNEAYIAGVDVVLCDWYPVNREAGHYPLTFKADELNYVKAHGAKAVGSFIETDWQWLNKGDARGRQPTPDEVEQEVRLAVAAGAQWIVYFSTTQSGHWGWPASYDTTPPEVVARITWINAQLLATPDVHPGLPPSTGPATTPPTTPTTVPIADNLKPLVPPTTLPAAGISPGRVVHVYCDTNPTPVFGPNPDWLGLAHADETDRDGRPKWIRINRATGYARALGMTPCFFVYDGTLNNAGRWCDAQGGLLPEDAPGTIGAGAFANPPADVALRAVTRLARKADAYGDGGANVRPIVLDLENPSFSYDPAAPLATRRAVLTNVLNATRTIRQASRHTVPVYVYFLFPIAGDNWDGDVSTADVDDLLLQIRKQVAGACVDATNDDLSLATGGRGWFDSMRQRDVLIARQTPEFARSKVAIVKPTYDALGPTQELVAPFAGLVGKPVPIELWRRQLRWLVDHDWDVIVWTANANDAEAVREHLEFAAGLAAGGK